MARGRKGVKDLFHPLSLFRHAPKSVLWIMKQTQLVSFLKRVAMQSTEKVLSQSGTLKQLLTPAEAYRLYGRANVDRWVAEGLIHTAGLPGKSSKQTFNRTALERVAAASNRVTYTPVAER